MELLQELQEFPQNKQFLHCFQCKLVSKWKFSFRKWIINKVKNETQIMSQFTTDWLLVLTKCFLQSAHTRVDCWQGQLLVNKALRVCRCLCLIPQTSITDDTALNAYGLWVGLKIFSLGRVCFFLVWRKLPWPLLIFLIAAGLWLTVVNEEPTERTTAFRCRPNQVSSRRDSLYSAFCLLGADRRKSSQNRFFKVARRSCAVGLSWWDVVEHSRW